MLDIKKIAENVAGVQNALLKRMTKQELGVEGLVGLVDTHKAYKEKLARYEEKRAEQNKFNEKVANLDKDSDEFQRAILEVKDLAQEVKQLESEMESLKEDYETRLSTLPNIPDDDVPAGGKEANEVIGEWGKEPKFDFEIKDHLTLGTELGILDFDRAAKMSGAQFPLYFGDGAMMVWALINYFIHEHAEDGYECVIPPHLLNEESAFVAGQLPKFKDDVYWTTDGYCLLPTSETALINIHRGEILSEDELPKKYFSYTPCYRRESGAYGARDKGLMRMHQFHKVEMFQYTKEEDSEAALDELVERAEKLVRNLGLRYRVTKLAGEDMSFGMAKTYDVEAWLPFDKAWTEVSSISNARDFQARRGNIRYKTAEGETKFVHTLNASGLATSRLRVALIETYQKRDGTIEVPRVLRPYMGKDVIKKQ